jgi:hypothetical protein
MVGSLGVSQLKQGVSCETVARRSGVGAEAEEYPLLKPLLYCNGPRTLMCNNEL